MIAALLAGVLLGADAAPPRQPKLTVIFVVDQMRADYLDRFQPIFRDGMLRLRNDGVRFTRAFHEHAVTATAPGHATLITGCDPAHHGLIANMIPKATPGKFKLAAIDEDTKLVGSSGIMEGTGSSPRDMLVDGLGDWLKAANPKSQVAAFGLKNRSAAMLGGQHPDVCCFLDDKTGAFVTSTYYGNSLPEFVQQFDREHPASAEFGKDWTPILCDAEFDAVFASADDMAYEGRNGLADVKSATFPHPVKSGADFPFTPVGDRRVIELAARAVEAMHLGSDDAPDLLCVGLSAADYIGHSYGPESRELADAYARLDRHFGELMRVIESKVAKGDVVYALAADHGVSSIPEARAARGLEGGRLRIASLTTKLDSALDSEFGAADWIDAILPDVYLDREAVAKSGKRLEEIAERAAEIARSVTGIEDAWTRDQVLRPASTVPRPFLRAFNPQRSGDVVLAFAPHWQLDYLETVGYVKTNHSTHHEYDQHIPTVFLGLDLEPTIRTERFSSVDFAPTLAALNGVKPSGNVDGKAHALRGGSKP